MITWVIIFFASLLRWFIRNWIYQKYLQETLASFHLNENRRNLIKNQFTQPESALSVDDEKWSKNHDDLIRPCRIIAPQISKADMSIFHELYTAITL